MDAPENSRESGRKIACFHTQKNNKYAIYILIFLLLW